MQQARYTRQVVPICTWVPSEIVHDVSVPVPGKHQGKAGNSCRYSVEGENILVFELFHDNCFLAEPLCRMLAQHRKKTVVENRTTLTL